MPSLTLVIQFRSQGVQWPLREGDSIEVRDGFDTIGEIPAYLVIELIFHHFHGLRLSESLRTRMNGQQALPPAKMPRRPVPIEVQEIRRDKRRHPRRKPSPG